MKKEIPVKHISEDEMAELLDIEETPKAPKAPKAKEEKEYQVNTTPMIIAWIALAILVFGLAIWLVISSFSQDTFIQDRIAIIDDANTQIVKLDWIIAKAQHWKEVENQRKVKARKDLMTKNIDYKK